MVTTCKICYKEIIDEPSAKRQYCSMPCYRLSRKEKPMKPFNFICLECGKKMRVRPSRIHKKYCSKKCLFKNVEFRKKRSLIAPKGEKSHLWRGGVSTLNEKMRKCSDYEIWRIKVFERDDYVCQYCKKRGGSLHADHIKPFALYPELRFEVTNGQTLCTNCHLIKTIKDMRCIAKEVWKKYDTMGL
jgi:hypothetical protein